MPFLRISKAFLVVSALLMAASAVLFFWTPGPLVSIEFTGGTLMELRLPEGKGKPELEQALAAYGTTHPFTAEPNIVQTKTGTFFVRMQTLDNDEHRALLSSLDSSLKAQELQYTTIGPTVGATLKRRAFYALLAASIAIVAYVALAFRKVPSTMSPWIFGVAAIAALLHDIVLMVGIFTVLSRVTAFQMDTLFVTALLSIMGYSVSDTIVIFDRIRDNLMEHGKRGNIADIATLSLRQSMSRTLNTGLGALIMLTCLFFFGSENIRWFMLALIVGTVIGTYSSFFIATPILVLWQQRKAR